MNQHQLTILRQARSTIDQQLAEIARKMSNYQDQVLLQLRHNIDFCFYSIEEQISQLRFVHMILPRELEKAHRNYGLEIPEELLAVMAAKRPDPGHYTQKS